MDLPSSPPPTDPTDSQARPPAEYTGLEATFPKATHLSQDAPLARLGSPPAEWDIFPHDDAASAVGSSTDDLELDIEFPATAGWGYELGLVEEGPSLCPSPRALLPRPGWDDELQKPGAQVYMRFMQEHTCYDAMATSSKMVIFDTMLEVGHGSAPPPSSGAAAPAHTLRDTLPGTPCKSPSRTPSEHPGGQGRGGLLSLIVIPALPFSICRILGQSLYLSCL